MEHTTVHAPLPRGPCTRYQLRTPGVPVDALMENAGEAAADAISQEIGEERR